MFLQFILIITFTFSIVYGQNLIQSGPMLGYADMREALIWVQTQNSAKVQIEYFEDKKPEKKFKTDVFQTQKTNAFCAKLICDQVEPGILYQYSVIINNKLLPIKNLI